MESQLKNIENDYTLNIDAPCSSKSEVKYSEKGASSSDEREDDVVFAVPELPPRIKKKIARERADERHKKTMELVKQLSKKNIQNKVKKPKLDLPINLSSSKNERSIPVAKVSPLRSDNNNGEGKADLARAKSSATPD